MDNKLYYPYVNTDEMDSNVSEQHKRKVLPVSLSESQLEAIDKAAAEAGMNRSEYIRHIFMNCVENFPDDLAQWGKTKTPKKLGA